MCVHVHAVYIVEMDLEPGGIGMWVCDSELFLLCMFQISSSWIFLSGSSEGVQQGVNIYPLFIIPFYTNVFSCVPFLSVVKLIVKANYTYQLKVLL